MFLTVRPLSIGRQARRHAGQRRRHTARSFGVYYLRCTSTGRDRSEVTSVAGRYFGSGDNPLLTRSPPMPGLFCSMPREVRPHLHRCLRQPYVPFYWRRPTSSSSVGIVWRRTDHALNISTVRETTGFPVPSPDLATSSPVMKCRPALQTSWSSLRPAHRHCGLVERAKDAPEDILPSPNSSRGLEPGGRDGDFWTTIAARGVGHRSHDHPVRPERQGSRGAVARPPMRSTTQ